MFPLNFLKFFESPPSRPREALPSPSSSRQQQQPAGHHRRQHHQQRFLQQQQQQQGVAVGGGGGGGTPLPETALSLFDQLPARNRVEALGALADLAF